MNFKNRGFTLIEVMIVIIIIAILAAVAMPKYSGAVERSKAAEGTYILGTLLSAQERFFLENSAFTSSVADLDVTVPTPKNFDAPAVQNSCAAASACATIRRNTGTYRLEITRSGTVSCVNIAGTPDCALAGY